MHVGMSREILDCLKRERDICIKTMIPNQKKKLVNYTFCIFILQDLMFCRWISQKKKQRGKEKIYDR